MSTPQIAGELQIQLMNYIDTTMENWFNNKVYGIITSELKKRDDLLNDYMTEKLAKKIDDITESKLAAIINNEILKTVGELKAKFQALEDRQKMLLEFRMPENYYRLIQTLQTETSIISSNMKIFSDKFDKYLNDETFEIVTNEELKALSEISGMSQIDLGDHFGYSRQRISQIMAESKPTTFEIRYRLKKFLMKKIQENQEKVNVG